MCILFHTAIHQSIFRLGLSCPLRMHEYEHLILLYCPLFCCCCCLPYFAAMKLRQFTCMQRGKGSFTACTLFDIYTIFSCCFFFFFLVLLPTYSFYSSLFFLLFLLFFYFASEMMAECCFPILIMHCANMYAFHEIENYLYIYVSVSAFIYIRKKKKQQ